MVAAQTHVVESDEVGIRHAAVPEEFEEAQLPMESNGPLDSNGPMDFNGSPVVVSQRAAPRPAPGSSSMTAVQLQYGYGTAAVHAVDLSPVKVRSPVGSPVRPKSPVKPKLDSFFAREFARVRAAALAAEQADEL